MRDRFKGSQRKRKDVYEYQRQIGGNGEEDV